MAQLTEKQRIDILMMIGFGDGIRSHVEVCDLFNSLQIVIPYLALFLVKL